MTRQHTRICGWIAAIVFASVFAWLGTWQLQRMHDKQALLAQVPLADAPVLALAQALEQPSVLHRISDHGRFLPGTVLLDNQLRQGRAGVRVYQPFRPAASATTVLVDLGWLPLPGNRVLPTIVPLHGEHALQGLLAPAPAAGLALGPALVDTAQPGVWLATRIDSAAISTRLQLDGGALAVAVLRLDPALPLGYARDLELLPNTLPPARHLGYAVQWYALALTVLVIALLLEWRARRRNGR